jgi:hypothetical protein
LEPFARPDASPAEVERGWRHILARHRRTHEVQEYRQAGEALARDWTEENLRHLRAQHQMSHGGEAEQTE